MEDKRTGGLHGDRFLILSFMTYLTVYLLRTNFSAAIPAISDQLGLSEVQLGLIGSIFFVVYASGQLINGFLSDVVDPYRFVTVALIGSTAANFFMAFMDKLEFLILIWACNGYFQSVFWGCLQRILALRSEQRKHTMIATVMSLSMICGFILSWVVLRNTLHSSSWRLFFFIPAVCGTALLPVWLWVVSRNRVHQNRDNGISPAAFRRSLGIIARRKLFYVCGVCLCLGFIKESISVWGPAIISRMLNRRISALALFVIPVGNFLGVFFAKVLADRSRRGLLSNLVPLFGTILAASAMILAMGSSRGMTVLMIVLVSGMSYGCNSILLSMVPLRFGKLGVVSTLIGIFDFTSYMGAALASSAAGTLIAGGNWRNLAFLWILCGTSALIFTAVCMKKIPMPGEN